MNFRSDPELDYLLPAPPPDGVPVEAAAGIRWLRLTLPLALDHINVWLLDEGESWTLVDTGISLPVTRAQWDSLLHDDLKQKPIRRIIVTHFHPDHIGLAQYLGGTLDCEVWMTRESAEIAECLIDGMTAEPSGKIIDFCEQHGFPDKDEYLSISSGEAYRKVVSGVPRRLRELHDGQVIDIGARRWRVQVVGGHARGHAMLYCNDSSVLISGDQILPTITTNVSFSRGILYEPDPLGQFLGSFDSLAALPADVLVMPSHGGVFRGLQARIGQLRNHHARTLDRILDWCREPLNAWQIALKLFGRPEPGLHSVLAFGETLAHLEYLGQRGRLHCRIENGQSSYECI